MSLGSTVEEGTPAEAVAGLMKLEMSRTGLRGMNRGSWLDTMTGPAGRDESSRLIFVVVESGLVVEFLVLNRLTIPLIASPNLPPLPPRMSVRSRIVPG